MEGAVNLFKHLNRCFPLERTQCKTFHFQTTVPCIATRKRSDITTAKMSDLSS